MQRVSMNFDQLRYFVETARFEHIGKAAKSVAISPSAISHAIANLEDELGLDPFGTGDNVTMPKTLGEFIALYENVTVA